MNTALQYIGSVGVVIVGLGLLALAVSICHLAKLDGENTKRQHGEEKKLQAAEDADPANWWKKTG